PARWAASSCTDLGAGRIHPPRGAGDGVSSRPRPSCGGPAAPSSLCRGHGAWGRLAVRFPGAGCPATCGTGGRSLACGVRRRSPRCC
nr:hypothetical protein [Tanacetum cinerariifolium]